jgi:hypothetical protein
MEVPAGRILVVDEQRRVELAGVKPARARSRVA